MCSILPQAADPVCRCTNLTGSPGLHGTYLHGIPAPVHRDSLLLPASHAAATLAALANAPRLVPQGKASTVSHFCIALQCLQVPGSGRLVPAVYDGNWDLEKDEGDRFYDAACWLLPAPTVVVSTSEDGMQLDVRNARLHEVAGVLPALLAAAVAAGRSVATLCLRACGVAPSTFEGCDLAVVTRLIFIRCFAGYGGQTLQPALGSVLRQTPALLHLTVYCHIWGKCLWAGLPEEATTLHRLESLNLIGTWLPHLNGVLEGMSGG